MLALTLSIGSIWVAYETPQEVEAVAIVDDAILIMLALFAACGVAPSYDHLTDGDNAQRLQDAIQQAYDQIRNQQIVSGGDGQEDPDNDEDPDNTPTWKKLLEDVKEAGHVRLTKFLGATGAWRILKKLADSQFFNFIKPSPDIGYNTTVPVTLGLDSLGDVSLSLGYSTFGSLDSKFLSTFQSAYDAGDLIASAANGENTAWNTYFGGDTILIYKNTGNVDTPYQASLFNPLTGSALYPLHTDYKNPLKNYLYFRSGMIYVLNPRLNIYYTETFRGEGYRDHLDEVQLIYGNGVKQDTIWVHPDIQDSFKNESDLELYPPTDPYNIPDVQALQALQQAMNNAKAETDPEAKTQAQNQALYDYFNKLGLQNSPVTDPVVDPKPNPGTNPDVTPTPSPTPTPDPDDPSGGMTADLRLIFPFCIPFDLIHLFEALDAEPVAPVFQVPLNIQMKNPFTGRQLVNVQEEFKIDFSDYEAIIKIFRIFEVIFFMLGLILITRSQMIKG